MGDVALMLVKTLSEDFRIFVRSDRQYKDEMRERIVRVEEHVSSHVSEEGQRRVQHMTWVVIVVGAASAFVSSVIGALIAIYL